jgi:hypothetical protein
MKIRLLKIVLIAFLSIIFSSSLAVSGDKGKEHDENRPPGWEKGEKKGWQSDKPPGLDKKDDQVKQKAKKPGKKQKKGNSKSEMESEFEKHVDDLENHKEAKGSELGKEKEKNKAKLEAEEVKGKGKSKKKKK